MKQEESGYFYKNCLLALTATAISALLMGWFFDFYFDLNDDTMMRDIMAGIYSGTPDGHNMQTLYPLGAVLSLCYRLCRTIPWYGLFLWACQFGCFFLAGVRVCALADAFCGQGRRGFQNSGKENGRIHCLRGKLLVLLALAAFQWGIWLTHMVNIQYTITCAMLSATAVFWFLTAPKDLSGKAFVWKNLPGILLVILAFQLRSEMLLLTLPFAGFAFFVHWWEERGFLRNLRKYCAAAGLLFLGMALSFGIDLAAYGSVDWKDFRQFFDDRTTVYDYYMEVVTQDSYSGDLQALGVSPAQQTLLRNYDFGLDERIDTQMLGGIASYAVDFVGGERDFGVLFREALRTYRYRLFHGGDAPYNLLVLLGYAGNAAAAILFAWESRGKESAGVGKRVLLQTGAELVLLALMRSALWLFILLRGRDPERITHSLYLVEFVILTAMLWRRYCANQQAGRAHTGAAGAGRTAVFLQGLMTLFLLLMAGRMAVSLPAVSNDQRSREEINREWQEIDEYCRAREENFYFEDVYSTVSFSGGLFEGGDHSLANYDIAGGWMCKSPLYREKLSHYGIGAAAEALLEGRAYFIMSDVERLERGLTWLTDYFAEQGIETEIEELDRIHEKYGVYKVKRLTKTGSP